jgi:hypothetical protein
MCMNGCSGVWNPIIFITLLEFPIYNDTNYIYRRTERCIARYCLTKHVDQCFHIKLLFYHCISRLRHTLPFWEGDGGIIYTEIISVVKVMFIN